MLLCSFVRGPAISRHRLFCFLLDHEQSPSLNDLRKVNQKPCFEDRIKATFIEDDADPSISPREVIEPLHEDDSDRRGSMDPQTRRKQWLRQAISVDGEKVSRKLLHQCSLDVSYQPTLNFHDFTLFFLLLCHFVTKINFQDYG